MDFYTELLKLIDEQEKWRSNCLNMIASENITSPAVAKAFSSDFEYRYAEGLLKGKDAKGFQQFERFYQGTKYIDRAEAIAIKLCEEIFNAEHANVVPISGVVANLTAFYALAKYGDKISTLSIPAGGHISHTQVSAAGIIGLKEIDYVFDEHEMNIDVDASRKMLLKEKPKIMMLGGSIMLFPHPVKELRETADEIGAAIVYDAAHVLGLIAGGKFQKPLEEGADVLTSSTHKTMPGPQGGVVMCKEKFAKKIDDAAFPGLTSNHHLHHVVAFAVALAEMKKFGRQYAEQIVKNSKALAQALHEYGFNVLCEHKGFTESHQVVVDVSKIGGGKKVAEAFEEANIIINKNLMPWDDVDHPEKPSGIRIGVQELTHVGMKESEMKEVAKFMKQVAIDGKDPKKVRESVVELKKNFMDVKFCF